MNVDLIIGIIALIITIIGVVHQINSSEKRLNKFEGRIGEYTLDGKETEKFIKFIFKNEGKIIHLDIYIDNNEDLSIDENGIFMFRIPENPNDLAYGGNQYSIRVEKSDDFFFDNRFTSRKLTGYFKIIGFTGPNQGWMTALLKPVNIESI